MLDVRKGFVIVGCVAVGFVVSAGPGLVARAAEPQRWANAIATDVAPHANAHAATALAAQRRIAELERRVKQLEAEHSAAVDSSARELATERARAKELAASHNQALALENQQLARSEAAQRSSCELPDESDPKAQLRYWAQRMRDSDRGFRGRLSSDWNAALNVLLRHDRPLDPRNPWREPETGAELSQR